MNTSSRSERLITLLFSYQYLRNQLHVQNRLHHVKVNHRICVDPGLKCGLAEGNFKHRNHPGIMKVKNCFLPEKLEETIQLLSQKYPEEQLKQAGQRLFNYLWSRHLPPSDASIQAKAIQIEKTLVTKLDRLKSLSSENQQQIDEGDHNTELIKKLKRTVYHWEPVRYDVFRCFQYMTRRMPYDYSCLYRVLHEIKKRHPEFVPKTLLDFGSGLATAVWAANVVWEKSLHEHYCIDLSTEMNTVAQLLLQDGEEDRPMCFDNVYFRHFLPQSSKNQYDLVISAFSLMELPSEADRLDTLMSLWKKTSKYLVIIETGTTAGFTIINEARNLFLKMNEKAQTKITDKLTGYVFAPCPHDLPCPRVATNDGTPCNFKISFKPFFKSQHHHGKRSFKGEDMQATFSYLVMRKGKRNPKEPQWSRIVREVHKHPRKVPLNTCSADGELEHTVITRKRHGADLFMCARNSSWGDLLPALNRELNNEESE